MEAFQRPEDGVALPPANLPTYPATKDSDVEWLGRVPAHWEMRRLRYAVDLRLSNVDKHVRDNERPVRLCNYMDVYKNDRIHSDIAFMPATATQAEIDRFRLRRGDVLITKDSEDWTDIGVPALVALPSAETNILCGYHCAFLRPHHGLEGTYLFWLLNSSAGADQLRRRANGVTRYGVSKGTIGSFRLPLPPLTEQTTIVRFLDYVDRRVQRYIRAKENLIALLEEQKQAVIHQAVTGQIDVRTGQPYPGYKDSGVEWLGDVPEHWEKISLGLLAESVQTGPFGSQLHAAEYRDGGVPVINPSHMRGGSLAADSSVAVSPQKARELSRHQLEAGDLVMARRGELGRCALVKRAEAGWLCGTGSLRVRPNKYKVAPTFLLHVLSSPSTRAALHLWSLGATMANLNAGLVSRLPVFAPPLAEQLDIVEFLQRANDETAAAVGNAHRQIDLLDKYRTRLIADVVTGKLDIREAAASLPKVDPLGTEDNLGATVYDAPDPSPPFSESETVQTADT